MLQAAGNLKLTKRIFQACNGGVITNFLTIPQNVIVVRSVSAVSFMVMNQGRQAILGLNVSETLGLVRRVKHHLRYFESLRYKPEEDK